ncbi:cleavage stimulation factor, 3' pre-RNA, subunit 1 [Perkinsus olseni]|uniref:Cleavage stimulation factor 50 kDa subunit n=1 Tax=Perkinsus olseni TaxID=32597 RepID=A0A7J6LWP6_PEROL|nr:cleavage stimulation factor, 3' pre-RNA, subunit 1 [Perkinsus olseni]
MASASSTFHHQAAAGGGGPTATGAAGAKRAPQVGLNFKAQKLGFYRYVVSQLYGDGLMDEAKSVATRLNLSLPVEPSNEENENGNVPGGANASTDLTVGGAIEKDFLYDVYADSIRRQEKGSEADKWKPIKCRPYPPLSAHEDHLDLRVSYNDRLQAQLEAEGRDQPFKGRDVDEMDLDDEDDDAPRGETYEEDMITEEAKRVTRPTPVVRLRFTTQHKKEVRCVAFSPDGRLCASGSTDTSIKVLETAKMRMHAVAGGDATLLRAGERDDGLRPVVRTYYDHVGTVTSVSFHPRQPILFSGSYDKTLKVYDLTKPHHNKRAQHNVVDVYPINKVQVHPCGDFVYVGTLHRVIRLYDTRTLQCFSAYYGGGAGAGGGGGGGQHHNGSVLDIACASDGSVFASAGSDGHVHLWDGVSNRLINKLHGAPGVGGSTVKPHSGHPVFTVQWSRNCRYLLTSGGDHRARLWDMRTGKELMVYSGATTSTDCSFMTATFAGNEQYIATTSSRIGESDMCLLDSLTGDVLVPAVGGHSSPVRAVAASPVDKTIITGCDDNKVRFFDIVKGTKNIYEMEEEGITGISQSQAAAGMEMDETGAAVVPSEGGGPAARGFVEHIGT